MMSFIDVIYDMMMLGQPLAMLKNCVYINQSYSNSKNILEFIVLLDTLPKHTQWDHHIPLKDPNAKIVTGGRAIHNVTASSRRYFLPALAWGTPPSHQA